MTIVGIAEEAEQFDEAYFMSFGEDGIRALREALNSSPENVPLRRHLAQMLLTLGRAEEAEREFREALALDPTNGETLFGLAQTYFHQGKRSQAFVILEDLVRKGNSLAKAHVLYARMLFQDGDVQNAVAQYKLGLERDPAAADEQLASELGISQDEDSTDEVVDGRVRQSWDDDASGSGARAEIERPRITFADVGGMESLKEEIGMKIILPLKHPEMYRAYGKVAGGGILMYGPPGCGKTYLARATAGEIKASFIAVGINDVLDMWVGRSERNLHELFEQARMNTPCVLFFDEVDALGGRRADMHSGSSRQLINQFLSEMDGVKTSNEGVLILAATNAPWHVDPAFRRPGRFDRVLFVPPPDTTARAEILRILCRNKPMEQIDFEQLAKKTDGFSGADLKGLVDQAVETKLREAFKSGVPKPLATKDLLGSTNNLKPTTREWFATARNYALYSNQGGTYDDVLKYLKLT